MHPIQFVEVASLGVLGVFTALEVRRGTARALAPLALTLVLASLLAEDTCIRWYGFYAYEPQWHLIIDFMPLMVSLIWPFVILSDRRVVAAITGEASPWLPLLTGLWVAWDACLMESVAVHAGLWHWTQPGLFEVPVIGVLGWGYFAAAALWLWGKLGSWRWLTVLLAPALTHALLLLTWWGGLRWILRGPIPDGVVVASGALLGLGLAAVFWRRGIKVPLAVMAPRVLAASVFGVLLLIWGLDSPALVAFVATFVLPYVVLTDWRGALAPDPGDLSPFGR